VETSAVFEDNRIDTLHYRVPQNHINPTLSFPIRLAGNETVTQNGQTTNTYGRSLGTYRIHFLEDVFLEGATTMTLPYKISYSYPNQSPVYTEDATYPVDLSPSLELGWKAFANAFIYVQYTHNGFTRTITPGSF
jgi:hypothetical protein